MKRLRGVWPYISLATGIVLLLSLVLNSIWLNIAFCFMAALLFALLAIEVFIQEKKNVWLMALLTVFVFILAYFGIKNVITIL